MCLALACDVHGAEPAGRVVELDGVASYVELPDGLGEDLKEATLEFQVRWDALTYYASPLAFGDTKSSLGFLQSESSAAPKLYVQSKDGQPRSLTIDEGIEPGVWIHLAGTWDASGMRFWINGTSVGTNASAVPGLEVLKAAPARSLGRSPWKENGYFRGRIDELRLWRRALSDREMRDLPHRLPGPSEPGLVARWSMDDWHTDNRGTVHWSTGERRLAAVLRGRARVVPDDRPPDGVLPRPWFLTGIVRDPSGIPSTAELEWRDATGQVRRWTAGADGVVLRRGLGTPGTGRLTARKGTLGATMPVEFGPSRHLHLELALRQAVSIEGHVDFLDGSPAESLGIRASRLGENLPRSLDVFETRTDARGAFRFVALPSGEYEVSCEWKRDPLNPSERRVAMSRRVQVPGDGATVTVHFEVAGDRTLARWRQVTRVDGLPDPCVGPLAADEHGRLWLGSASGLSRFDGHRFKTWSRRDGLPALPLTALEFDRTGTLWIGSAGGLSTFDGSAFRSRNSEFPGLTARITDLAATDDGSIWVGTWEGLYRRRAGVWQRYGIEDGLPAAHVYFVWPWAEDAVAIQSEGGRCAHVRDTGIEILPRWDDNPALEPPGGIASGIPPGQRLPQVTWKGLDKTIWHRDGSGLDAYDLSMPRKGLIQSIVQLGPEEAWVSTLDHGLWTFGEVSAASLTPRDGLPSAPVHVSLRARDGSVWIGTESGLTHWENGAARTFRTTDGLPSDTILSLHEFEDGTLWIGTSAGLAARRSNGFEIRPEVPRERVLLVGSRPNAPLRAWVPRVGMWILTNDRWAVHEPDRLQSYAISVRAVASPVGGTWMLTLQGPVRLGDHGPHGEAPSEPLPIQDPSTLLEAADGSVWVGTWAAGLHRRDPDGRWEHFAPEQGFPSPAIYSLHQDARGWIWAGTLAGVGLYRDGLWSFLDAADGLAGNTVRHIRSEPDGSVWFSTDGGLTRYSPSTKPPRASWMNGQGSPTQATNFTLKATAGATVHLGVDMTAGHRVRWRFGTPDSPGVWSTPVRDREIQWTPTTLGTAVVEAQVLDRDLNPSQVLLGTLQVHPVWYRNPSRMIPLIVLFLGVGGWVAYLLVHLSRQRRLSARLREEARALEAADVARMDFERRLIRGQEAERGRIARELHDSLGQELLLIRHAAMLASRATPESTSRTALTDIADRAARSIKEVRSIAYALRPQELDRYGMVMAMRTLCEERAEIHAIEIAFHAPPEVPKAPVETEIGLFRILQECLTNALKHAGASRIECTVSPRDHGIELRVADDGRGFDPDTVRPSPSGGLGLGGMRERARLLHGSVALHSQPGKGTIVEVWIPVPSGHSDPSQPSSGPATPNVTGDGSLP